MNRIAKWAIFCYVILAITGCSAPISEDEAKGIARQHAVALAKETLKHDRGDVSLIVVHEHADGGWFFVYQVESPPDSYEISVIIHSDRSIELGRFNNRE